MQAKAHSTFTESLKDKYIFKLLDQERLYFNGLKTHAAGQEARIEWHERNHLLYFEEYLIQQNARKRSECPAEIKTFGHKPRIGRQHAIKRRIEKITRRCDIKAPVDDLYLAMHNILMDNLQEDYQLHYLLYAVSCFKQHQGSKFKTRIIFIYPQNIIRYRNQVLEYNKRELIA